MAEVMFEPPAATRPAFAMLGACALATALLGGAGAVVFADDRETAAACALAGLVLLALGIVLAGAPFARAGKPSLLRIVALFLAGAGGLVLMRELSMVVVIGVVGVSYAIVVMSLYRWPPSEWLARDERVRMTRLPAGGVVATLGSLYGFLGLIGLAADLTGAVRVLVMVLVGLATLAVWARLASVYAGPGPSRRPPPA